MPVIMSRFHHDILNISNVNYVNLTFKLKKEICILEKSLCKRRVIYWLSMSGNLRIQLISAIRANDADLILYLTHITVGILTGQVQSVEIRDLEYFSLRSS